MVYVDKDTWSNWLNTKTKDEIKEILFNMVRSGKIQYPLADITLQDAENSFVNLKQYKCKPFMYSDDVCTRYEYKYDIGNKYIDETVVGNAASNYFNQELRFKVESRYPSPFKVWNNDRLLLALFNSFFSLKFDEINDSNIRAALSLRYYIPSQFKPAVAKSIYTKFNSKKVLDFSSGWGDRLCGFYASPKTEFYYGIDPNVDVYRNYFRQVKLYEKNSWSRLSLFDEDKAQKQCKFVNLPAEDVDLEDYMFDTVFTSPPYFNVERYTDNDNQSWKKYNNLDLWLNGFLFKTLKKCWEHLLPGGHMIINISDAYTDKGVVQICDPMNDFISTLNGAKFVECIGMKLAKRPKNQEEKDGTWVEPMWVWKKEK